MANGLAVVLALALITLMSRLVSTLDDTSSGTLWSAVLPNVAVPTPLQKSISPVENTPLATRFAAALTRGAVFPSMSTAFCTSASLICDENLQISSYGPFHNSHTNTNSPRASSIKTINDFQFDFFLEEHLLEGNHMRLSSDLHDPIPSRAFLPSAVATALPALTTTNLPKLRNIFNIQENTPMATMMGTAAYLCENAALPGEEKACAITLPAMAQFVAEQLGTQVVALATEGAPDVTTSSVVKIESVTKRSVVEGEHIVICHTVMFPSALYYCHHVTGTKVVQAKLRVDEGTVIDAVGICHLDTSLWASEHPAFKALDIPRGAEACHWTVQNDVVWVAAGTQ